MIIRFIIAHIFAPFIGPLWILNFADACRNILEAMTDEWEMWARKQETSTTKLRCERTIPHRIACYCVVLPKVIEEGLKSQKELVECVVSMEVDHL